MGFSKLVGIWWVIISAVWIWFNPFYRSNQGWFKNFILVNMQIIPSLFAAVIVVILVKSRFFEGLAARSKQLSDKENMKQPKPSDTKDIKNRGRDK